MANSIHEKDNGSKCDAVSKRMLDFIREEKIPANGKLPPLRELSSKFNVSLATLRKAVLSLEKSGDVSIRHGSGVYVVEKHGELVMETTLLKPVGDNRTICIIDSFSKGDIEGHYLDNFVLSETIQGAKEACITSQCGLKVLSFVVGEGESAIMQRLAANKDTVALMVATQHFMPYLPEAHALGIPAVVLGPSGNKAWKYEVDIDLFEAGVLAGEYLAKLGHQKVLYVGTEPLVGKTSCLRHAGFCYAHQSACQYSDIQEIFVSDVIASEDSKHEYLTAAQRVLDAVTSVSALFISSEQIALSVVPFLLQHGIRIPQTVSLVTVDNSRFGRLFTPMWTTIDLNRPGAAQAGVQFLMTYSIDTPPEYYNSLVPSKLIVRESAVPLSNGLDKAGQADQ